MIELGQLRSLVQPIYGSTYDFSHNLGLVQPIYGTTYDFSHNLGFLTAWQSLNSQNSSGKSQDSKSKVSINKTESGCLL
jgi:hypothetical protein